MDEERKVRKPGGREGEGQVGSRRDRLTDCFDGVQYPHGHGCTRRPQCAACILPHESQIATCAVGSFSFQRGV